MAMTKQTEETKTDLLEVAVEARRLLRMRNGKSISEHKLLDALDAAIAKATGEDEPKLELIRFASAGAVRRR
jgi:hypothetical protein